MANNSISDILRRMGNGAAPSAQVMQIAQQAPQKPVTNATSSTGKNPYTPVFEQMAGNPYTVATTTGPRKSPGMQKAEGELLSQQRAAQQEEAEAKVRGSIWDILKNGLALQNMQYLPTGQQLEMQQTFMQQQADAARSFSEGMRESKEAAKLIEWEGRADLVKQYQSARRRWVSEGHKTADHDEMDRLRNLIVEGDILAGNGERDIDTSDRIGSSLRYVGKNIASSLTGFAANVGQKIAPALLRQQMLNPDQYMLSVMFGEDPVARYNQAAEAAQSEEGQQIWNTMYDVSSRVGASARQDLSRAKNGLNALARAGVDIGTNMLEMTFDAGVAAATGGSALVPMFIRVAGESMVSARDRGVEDLDTRLAYGFTKGAIETFTEMIFDGTAGIYGKGMISHDVTASLARRLASTKFGRAIIRLVLSSTEEGLEEIIAGVLDPFAEKIVDKDAKWKDNVDVGELLYEGMIGFFCGFLGTAGGAVTNSINGVGSMTNVQDTAIDLYEQEHGRPGLLQEARDRVMLNNLAQNPNYYRNTDNISDALVADRAGRYQEVAEQALQEQVKAREEANGVRREPGKNYVMRNGVKIKDAQTLKQVAVRGMLTLGEVDVDIANEIVNNEEYAKAFTELTGIELNGDTVAKVATIVDAFNNARSESEAETNENAPVEEQESSEPPSRELNNQPTQEEAPAVPEARPETRPEAQPEARPEARPEPQAEAREETQEETQEEAAEETQGETLEEAEAEREAEEERNRKRHARWAAEEAQDWASGNESNAEKYRKIPDSSIPFFDAVVNGEITSAEAARRISEDPVASKKLARLTGIKDIADNILSAKARYRNALDALNHILWAKGHISNALEQYEAELAASRDSEAGLFFGHQVRKLNRLHNRIKAAPDFSIPFLSDIVNGRISIEEAAEKILNNKAALNRLCKLFDRKAKYILGDDFPTDDIMGMLETVVDIKGYTIKPAARNNTQTQERSSNPAVAAVEQARESRENTESESNATPVQERTESPFPDSVLGERASEQTEAETQETKPEETPETKPTEKPITPKQHQTAVNLWIFLGISISDVEAFMRHVSGMSFTETEAELRKYGNAINVKAATEADVIAAAYALRGTTDGQAYAYQYKDTGFLKRAINNFAKGVNNGTQARQSADIEFDGQTETGNPVQEAGQTDQTGEQGHRLRPQEGQEVTENFGENATVRDAESPAEQRSADIASRSAGENATVSMVDNADSGANGATVYNSDGSIHVDLSTNNPGGETGADCSAAHEGTHAGFLNIFGGNVGQGADVLLDSFLADHPQFAQVVDRVRNVLSEHYEQGMLSEELFSYIAGGDVRVSNDAEFVQQLDALQDEVRNFLINNGIVAGNQYENVPTVSAYNNAISEAVAEAERQRQAAAEDLAYRRRNGQLTEEEIAQYRQNAEAVRSRDTNQRLPRLAEWASEWASKWGSKRAGTYDGQHTAIHYHENLAKVISDFANGIATSEDLYNAYEALNSEDASWNSRYFYEPDVAANLRNLYEMRERLRTGETYDVSEYSRLCEQTVRNLEAKLNRLDKMADVRTRLFGETAMEQRVQGHGFRQMMMHGVELYLKTQSRIDSMFRVFGGFNEQGSETWYDFAKRSADAEKRLTTVGHNARAFFYFIQSQSPEMAKAWADLESGKIMGNVDVPYIGKMSLNYELSLLRTLETEGGIDHIAGNGFETADEADYNAGRNNNGWGNKPADHNVVTREQINKMAEPFLRAEDVNRPTTEEWDAARHRALESLRDELRADVMSSEIGRTAYEASVEMFNYLAREVNKTSVELFGYKKALNKDYYPLFDASSNTTIKALSERAYDMNSPDFLTARRKGSKQALRISPFAETTLSYIQEASNWTAFAGIWSDLQMLDKTMDQPDNNPTITGMVNNAYGNYARKYLADWEKVISNNRPKSSVANKLLGNVRKNIAQASLTLNPGVALKQTPSYYAAASILDMDVLIKSRIANMGFFRTAGSYNGNPLIREVDSRSGIISNRKAGWNIIELGESLDASRSIGQKVIKHLPNWMTNWITGRDVSTISNLALACGEQVNKWIAEGRGGYEGMKIGSDAYYDEVTKLLEDVVVNTQPIYDPQFRAEMLRSDNELLRSAAMFRTQQTQDFNNLYTVIGEYQAARRMLDNGGTQEAVDAAGKRLSQTIAGQLVAKAAFSALTILADLITHRTKKYKDDEGNWSALKFLQRFAFGTASSAASVLWFGDTVAAVIMDIATGVSPFEDTSEFYSISEATVDLINNGVTASITFFQTVGDPDKTGWQKAKAAKEAAVKIASMYGIPLQNAYNILNTIVMYEMDTDPTKNFDHNDDFMRSMSNYSQLSDTAIARKTMDRAAVSFSKGKLSEADSLLATLNFESNSIISSVASSAKEHYIDGTLTESQYRTVLKDYCKKPTEDVEKALEEANRDIAYNEAKANNKKGFEAAEALINASTDKLRDDDRPRDYYVMDSILASTLTDEEKDVTVGTNLSEEYRTNYNVLRGASMTAAKTAELLEAIDSNHTGSIDQDELYKWYLGHKADEKKIEALFNAKKYEKGTLTWKKFLDSKKNVAYDEVKLANEGNAKFAQLDEYAKQLQSDSRIIMQKADTDQAIYGKISAMGLKPDEFDAAVQQYVSSGGRKIYNAARNEGYSPDKAVALIKAIDSYYQPKSPDSQNNGSVSIAELIAYYKDHPDEEAVIKAIYYASTTSSKTWEDQKKKAKIK